MVNALVAAALYEPLGIAGIVIGTVVGTVGMTVAQGWMLRPDLGGIEGARTPAPWRGCWCRRGCWRAPRTAPGRARRAARPRARRPDRVGGRGIAAGFGVYAAAVWAMGIPEARQIRALLPRR